VRLAFEWRSRNSEIKITITTLVVDMTEDLKFVSYWIHKDLRLLRRRYFGGCDFAHVPIGFDLLPLERLFLFAENVLLSHSDLKALVESTPLAEASIGYVHATSLVIGTLEIVLQDKQRIMQKECKERL